MKHLTPDEVVDALDDALAAERRQHWQACPACRSRTEELRHLLDGVHAVEMVAPSPLFWTHFADRVRRAVAEEDLPRASWQPPWLRLRVMTPVAALTLLVAVLVTAVPRTAVVPSAPTVDEPTVLADGRGSWIDASRDDPSWRLVVNLVDDMAPGGDLEDGFVVTPALTDRVLRDLGPAERDELVRLLRVELGLAGTPGQPQG